MFEDSGSEGDVEGELPSDSVSSRSQSSELGPENQVKFCLRSPPQIITTEGFNSSNKRAVLQY